MKKSLKNIQGLSNIQLLNQVMKKGLKGGGGGPDDRTERPFP